MTMLRAVTDIRFAAQACTPAVETERPVHILMVDDNLGDTRLALETLREDRILNKLSVVTDGELALRFLRRQPPYTDATRPDLVLVDLTLPRLTGLELVAEMRADAELRSIPVALLTASATDQALLGTCHVQADICIRKPVDAEQLLRIVAQVGHFGIRILTTSSD